VSTRTRTERSQLAHDLRTPLAIIVGYAQLLERHDSDAVRRAASENIVAAAGKLSQALDALVQESA
jgi:signal transduction histidine kinase